MCDYDRYKMLGRMCGDLCLFCPVCNSAVYVCWNYVKIVWFVSKVFLVCFRVCCVRFGHVCGCARWYLGADVCVCACVYDSYDGMLYDCHSNVGCEFPCRGGYVYDSHISVISSMYLCRFQNTVMS